MVPSTSLFIPSTRTSYPLAPVTGDQLIDAESGFFNEDPLTVNCGVASLSNMATVTSEDHTEVELSLLSAGIARTLMVYVSARYSLRSTVVDSVITIEPFISYS